MTRVFRKPIISGMFLVVIALVLSTSAWASNIDLYALDSNSAMQINGSIMTINAMARGIGGTFPNFDYDIDPDANFKLTAYNDNNGNYSGSLSIISPDTSIGTLFAADFSQLAVNSVNIFGYFDIYSLKLDNYYITQTDGFLEIDGFELFTVKGGPFNGAFQGQITGVKLPEAPLVHNPEPATFLLLGFGLLGLANISRKKKPN